MNIIIRNQSLQKEMESKNFKENSVWKRRGKLLSGGEALFKMKKMRGKIPVGEQMCVNTFL